MFRTRRHLAVLAAAGAAALSMLVGGAAQADRVQYDDATGNTTVKLGGALARVLTSNGCGPFIFYAPTGDAEGSVTATGALKLVFPIQRVVFSGANGFRIVHSGGVEFYNACYDVKISNLYVQNFGEANQFTYADVTAKTIAGGTDVGRTEAFTVDFSGANGTYYTKNHGTRFIQKIRGLDLLLGDDGAAAFNTLATGSPTGPLYSGEQVGKARTAIRLPIS